MMKLNKIFCALCMLLFFSASAFAENFPTNKGSSLLSGELSFSSISGSSLSRQNIFNLNSSFVYFIIPNFGLGGDLGLNTTNSITSFTIGPNVSYFFGGKPKDNKIKGLFYPYLTTSFLVLSSSANTSGFMFKLGGGGVYMISNNTGLNTQLSYQIAITGGNVAFNVLGIGAGFVVFFY